VGLIAERPVSGRLVTGKGGEGDEEMVALDTKRRGLSA
jgi:hypothetical protein